MPSIAPLSAQALPLHTTMGRNIGGGSAQLKSRYLGHISFPLTSISTGKRQKPPEELCQLSWELLSHRDELPAGSVHVSLLYRRDVQATGSIRCLNVSCLKLYVLNAP